MRRAWSLLTIFLMIILNLTHANAAYVKASLGLASLDQFFTLGLDTTEVGVSLELDSQVSSPISLIYGFGLNETLGMELDLSLRNNKTKVNDDAKVSALSLGVSAVYRFAVSSSARPYLGSGIAIGQYEIKSPTYEDDSIAFALQTFIGVDFKIVESWGMGFEARHFSSFLGPKMDLGGVDVDGVYKQFSLAFTSYYSF